MCMCGCLYDKRIDVDRNRDVHVDEYEQFRCPSHIHIVLQVRECVCVGVCMDISIDIDIDI